MSGTATGDAPHRFSRHVDVATAILLALAAVATAWASYQSSRWHGQQSLSQARATSLRVESTRSSALATGQTEVDVATFIQWSDATLHDEPEVADYYRARFRDEFAIAFDAWFELDPLTDPDAPPTPFAMPEYELAATAEADRLEDRATEATAAARANVQQADNFVLCVVLFAAALFFAGISTRLRSAGPQLTILVLGYVVFLGALGWMLTFPVSFAT